MTRARFKVLKLWPAWTDDFYGIFVDSNDPELLQYEDANRGWIYWTTSS